MSGTNFTNFVAHTLEDANQLNENFDWLEGHLEPMSAGTKVTNTYDIGSSSYQWRTGYFRTGIVLNSTTITGVDNQGIEVSAGNIRIKQVRGTTANSAGTRQEITPGTISKIDIRANAVTNYSKTGSGFGAFLTTITTVTINVLENNNPVLILASGSVKTDTSAGNYVYSVTLFKATGTTPAYVVLNGTFAVNQVQGLTVGEKVEMPFSIAAIDNSASAGSVTYAIAIGETQTSLSIGAYSLFAFEMRR